MTASVQSAASLTYADLETTSSEPKDLIAAFSHSKVPLQRLICARSLSLENDTDPMATALKLSKDPEPIVREAIALRLGQINYGSDRIIPDKAVSTLLMLARDIKPEVRSAAATSLAIVPHRNQMSSWLSLCREKDPRYRSSGAECLGNIGKAQISKDVIMSFALPELIALAKEDVSFIVRKSSCRALGKLCQEWTGESGTVKSIAADCILFLAHDPAWPVRRAVAEAIPLVCGCGDKKVDTSLASALVALSESDSSKWVKLAAKRSLGIFLTNSKSDAPEALTAYCNLAKSTDEEVRFACAYSLPGVVLSTPGPAEPRWNSHLKGVHALLCSDASSRIRCSLAHSLHVIAKCVGMQCSSRDLSPVFMSFIQDMDDEEEIRLGVLRGAAVFLASMPVGNRREVFEMIETVRMDISAAPLASLAVSRDARLSLAAQLPQFSKIDPPVPGLGKMFLGLAKDEAHHVRMQALDSFGEIAPILDSAGDILKEFEEMSSSSHFWDRWAFARGAWSVLRNERSRKMFGESTSARLEQRVKKLQDDSVLTVRTEAKSSNVQAS